jgi:hypothetical protein
MQQSSLTLESKNNHKLDSSESITKETAKRFELYANEYQNNEQHRKEKGEEPVDYERIVDEFAVVTGDADSGGLLTT